MQGKIKKHSSGNKSTRIIAADELYYGLLVV